MRKQKYWMLCCLCLLLGQVVCRAQEGKQLFIYHTSDTHSRIEPIDTRSSDTASAGKAGAVRRATFFNHERNTLQKDEEMLIFDCGDFSQGSPFYNIFKGDVEIAMMNAMKYDACTIGNHEFDFGMDNMARIFRQADFPVVCSNYDFTGTVLEDLVSPYIILNRGGLKIGLFGLGCELKGMVQAKNCIGVKFLAPIEVAGRMINKLRNDEHCDLVICLSHLGESEDKKLIAATAGIDIVLGGHSHTYYSKSTYCTNCDGHQVLLSHTGKNACCVGKIKLLLE